ncbi:MAG: branched-chain amino acid ABC transporter permease, partial [Actinomycetota bacterium]|nr:branched-chain amino acid ABC transporter permease [Actinomycetota bacterium]
MAEATTDLEREAASQAAPEQESALQERFDRRELVPWVVFLAGFGLYPLLFDSPYLHNLGVLTCLYALMATGWNLLGGFTGQISLGHAMFFGVGAYAAAVGGGKLGLNPWASIVIGAALAVALALALGGPVFRLRGHYFAIATIALGEIMRVVFLNWEWVGGASGLSIPLQQDSLAELQFSGRQKWEYYYLALLLLVLALVATFFILRSRTGYYLIAIREDQKAAAAMGVPVTFYKQVAFAFSAVAVAVAGGFYAQYVLFVDPPSTLALLISIQITIAAILGGVR